MLIPAWREAIRAIRRSPGFAALVVLTLTLGIGANGMMLGVLDELVLRPPRQVVHPEQLYGVSLTMRPPGAVFTNTVQSYPIFEAVAAQSTVFSAATMYASQSMSLGSGVNARPAQVMMVSGGYFGVFGTTPLLGRVILPADDAIGSANDVAVVSEHFWKNELGGRPTALGQRIVLDNVPYTVVGVLRGGFAGTRYDVADVWAPVNAVRAHTTDDPGHAWRTNVGYIWVQVVGRLRSGVDPAQAATRLTAAIRPLYPAGSWQTNTAAASLVSILPLRAPKLDESARIAILLAAVSLLVLVAACVNVTNLTLARNTRRRHELTVRLVLGARRSRLVAALLFEAIIVAAIGGVLAIACIRFGGPLLLRFLEGDRSATMAIDGRMLVIAIGVTLIATLGSAIVPAIHLMEGRFATTLRESRGSSGNRGSRRTLLALQCASCTALLIGTGLFMRSLHSVSQLRLGFDPDAVWVGAANLGAAGFDSAQAGAAQQALLTRIRQLPGISAAALTSNTPLSGWSYGRKWSIPGRDSLPRFAEGGPYYFAVSDDYFRTTGTRILRGRAIDASDRAGSAPVLAIDELVARTWFPGEDPIGKCIVVDGPTAPCSTVVGVVENSRRQQLVETASALIYLPIAQSPRDLARAQVVVRAVPGFEPTLPLRRALQGVSPELPFADVHSLRAQVDPLTTSWRLGETLFILFSVITLALATIGVYGVFMFTVQQRRRELGIRLAIGARPANVAWLVLSETAVIALVGAIVGVAGAAAASSRITPLLFGTSALDPVTFAAATVAVLGIAVMASALPARRASRIEPMVAFRGE